MKVPPAVGALVAGGVARGLAATWRYRWRSGPTMPGGGEGRGATGPGKRAGEGWRRVRPPEALSPAVYALWHEHLLPLAMLHRDAGAVALVSRHRDGEILARVLVRMGFGVARGSSTRGGGEGLRRMVRAGRSGRPLAFTPDGPRGPSRRCKPGVVRAAAETELPVVPVAAAARPARRLESWDRFLVPLPGARVYVSHGSPLRVPREAAGGGGAELERWAERVEEALEAQRRACEEAAEAGGGGAG